MTLVSSRPPKLTMSMTSDEIDRITSSLYEYDETEKSSDGKVIRIGDTVFFECSQMYQAYWAYTMVVPKLLTWRQWLYLVDQSRVNRITILQ